MLGLEDMSSANETPPASLIRSSDFCWDTVVFKVFYRPYSVESVQGTQIAGRDYHLPGTTVCVHHFIATLRDNVPPTFW